MLGWTPFQSVHRIMLPLESLAILLSLPACVKFEPRSCRRTSCLADFVESNAQGDASFRTISVVQSMPQHSVPNSKSRFRSRVLLLSQFQGKSTSKLGLCCDTIGISATTTQKKISTLKTSGKRKFTVGHFATAYVCCPGSQGPCKGVELYKVTPSTLPWVFTTER